MADPETNGQTEPLLPPLDADAAALALAKILELLQPLSGGLVDLDLFADQDVEFRLIDARGKERTFPIPGDPPFPLVLAFLDAHDALGEARAALGRTSSLYEAALQTERSPARIKRASDAADAAKNAERAALAGCADAFAGILELRTPAPKRKPDERPGSWVLADFGANQLDHWWAVAIFRFNKRRLESAMGLSGKAVAVVPAAAKKRRRR